MKFRFTETRHNGTVNSSVHDLTPEEADRRAEWLRRADGIKSVDVKPVRDVPE